MLFTLVTMLTIAVSANAMSYEQARREALFLTDKMAYELNLTDAQYEAAYEINLDYLMGVTSQNDVFGIYWERRNLDISYILYSWQWDLFRAATYFYRPLYFEAGYWHFGIYARYPHRDYFYFGRPHFYVTYRGGHSWRHNGGRSYYERHHDHFRPHRTRDEHTGMRNGWDRGDYRGNHRRSSTRVTEGNDRHDRPGHDMDRDRRPNTTYGSERPSTTNNRPVTVNERPKTDTNRPTMSNDRPATTNGASRSSGTFSSSGASRNAGSISNSTSRSAGSINRGGTISAPSRGNSGGGATRGNGSSPRGGGRR